MVEVMEVQPTSGLPAHVLAAHLTSLRHRGHTAASVQARARALHRMAGRIPVPLLEATVADLATWRENLTVTGNTVIGYVSHAKDFYAWAVGQGLAASNPAEGLPLPRLVRGLPRPAGKDVLMDAVTTAPLRVRPWLVLAGWAGLRAKEIALLRRERVLETAAPPVILVASDATKGRRERVVAMSAFVVTLHQCRHRFASVLYQQTHDLRLVQELLGHQSPETTAGYAAYDRAGAADAVNAIPTPARLVIAEAGHG